MTDQSEKQSFLVEAEDGRKFKMVVRGDVGKISVEKIRRYLKSFGIPDGQRLMSGDLVLTDDMIGDDFGLQQNDVLHLSRPPPPANHSIASSSSTAGPSRVSNFTSQYAASHVAEPQVDVEGRRRQQAQRDEQFDSTPRSGSSRAPVRQAPSLPLDSSPSSAAYRSSAMQEARMAHRATASSTPPPSTASSQWNQKQQSATPPRGYFSDPSFNNGGVHDQERAQMDAENAQLRREVDALRLELDAARMSSKQVNPVESLLENAKRNLLELGKEIGMHLVLDQQLSCTIGTDERHTLLISFDAPTERLYVFSSLLNSIPSDPQVKLRLYEALLDGAFLGRDMAGGGCGVSAQNGIMMMSTSIQLRHCGPHALKDVVPVFIESLMRWRGVAEQICNSR